MSYILDALKKIEHEKNKKRSDGRRSIANDLFQERSQPTSRSGLWKMAALAVLASLIAGGGTWFALYGKSRRGTAVSRLVATQQATPVAPPPAVAPPAPMPVQALPPAGLPPAAVTPAAAAPHENAAADQDEETPSSRRVRRPAVPVKARPVVQKQSVQAVPAPADIKLSGIAWQDERSARRAVINGFLLKEGAVVSGATIIDIQANKVRFSSSGGQFEIRLDAVLPTELKR
jgi:general secretion pathway protein B